jgi:hypothetical protein
MSETLPRTVTREEFNRELVAALDDLVSSAKHHGDLIKASFERSPAPSVARETPPPYEDTSQRLNRIDERLDRIERTLVEMRSAMQAGFADIRQTMATKVELEAMHDKIKQVADGYQTINQRLDGVADLLKLRVVMP